MEPEQILSMGSYRKERSIIEKVRRLKRRSKAMSVITKCKKHTPYLVAALYMNTGDCLSLARNVLQIAA